MHFTKKIFSGILLLFTIGILIISVLNTNLTADESFTIALIHHSPIDLIKTDSLDVHPPLSYLIFKLIGWPLSHFTTLINLQIVYLRLWTLIFVGISIYGLTRILKIAQVKFNYYILSMFLVLSQIIINGLSLRMYQLVVVFLVYELLMLIKFEQTTAWRYFFGALGLAIAASYTHYFGAVFAGLLLFGFWINAIIQRNSRAIKRIPLLAIAFIIGFIPWMLIAYQQVTSVSQSYWITPTYSWLAFLQQTFNPSLVSWYAVLWIFVLLLHIIFWVQSKGTLLVKLLNITLGSYIATYGLGMLIAYVSRPVMVDRYLYPMFFIYLFLVLMTIPQLKISQVWFKGIIFLIPLIISGGVVYNQITMNLTKQNIATYQALQFKEQAGIKVYTPTNYPKSTYLVVEEAAKNPHQTIWISKIKYQYATNFVQKLELFEKVYPNIKPY